MTASRSTKFATAALLGALALAAPARRLVAQSTGAVLPTAVAFPATYTGNCPAPIEFIGHVTVTVPGTLIDYQWEHSDGKTGKVLHSRVGKARLPGDTTKRVNVTEAVASDKWHLALPGKSGAYSDVLHILAPFDIRSAPAVVQVVCND